MPPVGVGGWERNGDILDFSLLLVIATAVSGLVWALDVALFRRRRTADGPAPEPAVVEYSRSFFPILLAVLLIRSFLFEPFRIPSSSMMPTLLIGDFIFVNKFSYGLRLPVLHTKILDLGEPQRGDVIVFRLPGDPSTNYIKRLVGLPGDRITYRGAQLFVNGEPVPIETVGRYHGADQPGSVLARERLGDVNHDVLLIPERGSMEVVDYEVREGEYFFMGDNRDNSRDSRYPGVGPVPEENIAGRAVRIWMNWDFPNAPRWSRIGDRIH